MRRLLPLALLCLVICPVTAACGGGSGDVATTPSAGTPGPQVALLMVNGHSIGPAANYLSTTAGPFLEAALQAAGYSVDTSYFTDDPGGGAPGGYAELVAKLQQVFDDWIQGQADPTRIVIVPHSHGGVRAHSAIRAKPGIPVRLLADLDTSSNGWALVHPGEDAALGGNPVDAYVLPASPVCAAHPGAPNEAGNLFDIEDVVFDNVQEALEVRTGDIVPNPLQLEPYDERWNARLDGSATGLTCFFSGTLHVEPTLTTGTTLPFVRDWILGRLATDP